MTDILFHLSCLAFIGLGGVAGLYIAARSITRAIRYLGGSVRHYEPWRD